MSPTDLNILVFGGFFMLALIIAAAYMLMQSLSGPRKQSQAKLSKIKEKFAGGYVTGDARQRAIKGMNKSVGFDKFAESLIPKPKQLQERIHQTGRDIALSQYVTFSGILTVAAILIIFIVMSNIAIALALGIVIGLGLPHMAIGSMIKKRQQLFIKQFPDALDLIVRGLQAGLPVNEAIINVGVEIPAPVGAEFRKVSDDVRLGKTLEVALWDANARIDLPDYKFFVISLSVQRETGGNLGETLHNLASILRQRQQMKLKVKAMSSEAKASAYILGALPFVMLGLIMMMNYDYGIILFTHATAIKVAIGGLFWMSIGIFTMAKMIDFDI